MKTLKKISLSLLLVLSVVVAFAPNFADARPGESRACFNIDGTVIDLSGLPCPLGICADLDFGEECRRRGGTWGAAMPQYVGPGRSNAPVQDVNDALGVLVGIIRLAQIVFWVLTVGFGLYAAYLYLFSQGNKESAVQARRVFIYTIIAAILAVLAYAVPGVIDAWLTGN